MRRRLGGLLAAAGIAAILIGLPTLLLAIGFGPLPRVTSLDDLVALLLRRDDGTLALTVLKVAGWIVWAMLAGLIVTEILARLRGLSPRTLHGLGLPQTAARQLVAAAAALFVALPASSTTAAAAPVSRPLPPVTATQTVAPTAPAITRGTASEAPVAVATRVYTVKRGDTLWSIAGRELGNPRRYSDIAALNSRLLGGKGDGFLQPGWTLHLPHDPTDQADPEASARDDEDTYLVRRGDTLSEIALEQYGDATAYPRIAAASRTIIQPDGRRLTDPDHIDIGWTLAIPGTPATATRSAPDPARAGTTAATSTDDDRLDVPPPVTVPPPTGAARQPAPTLASTPGSAPAAGAAPATSTPETATTTDDAATQSAVDDVSSPAWLLAGLVGAGGGLAGSMWLALRRKRAAQHRARRPGRMIATPPPTLAPVEKTILTVGAEAAPGVEFLDELLRRLAAHRGSTARPMPLVAAVDLGESRLRLHLSEPCDLDSPWQAAPDTLHWSVPLDVALAEIGPLDPALPAPYPQLVTLGEDDDGHPWLLNLETAATIHLTGDPDYARDLVRHVAGDLALNPWSRDVAVECVGIAAEAVALNPQRVRHHDNPRIAANVLADAVAAIDRAQESGLDVPTSRATLRDDDLWNSHVLLLDHAQAGEATGQLLQLLHDHPHRTATAVVLLGDHQQRAGTEIQLTAHGRLLIPSVGLDLVAVGLTAQEARGCASIFAQADLDPDVPMPDHDEVVEDGGGDARWQSFADQAGHLSDDVTLGRDEPADEPAQSLLPEPDDSYLAVAATTSADLDELAPQVPDRVRHDLEAADPTLDADLALWRDSSGELPKLMLLGPLKVRVAPTGNPGIAVQRRPFLIELLTYLATRSHGATAEELAEAMDTTTTGIRKEMMRLRGWLGVNPRTGRPHIPDSRKTTAARTRGRNVYEVEDLLVDADLFRRLRARGEARGPAGLDDLTAALSLVTGTPFAQPRRDPAAWLAEGDRLDQILLCAIVDVAHVVTTAHLAAGNLASAQAAAELAARVAPYEEIPQLDLAAILDGQGHHRAAAQRLRDFVTKRSDDEDDIPTELPARSEQIIDRRRWFQHSDARSPATVSEASA